MAWLRTHFEQVSLQSISTIPEVRAQQHANAATTATVHATKQENLSVRNSSGGKVKFIVMIPPFDIFRTEADGSVLWQEAATTLEEAKARAQQLAKNLPGEYLILSHPTGNKLIVKSDPAA